MFNFSEGAWVGIGLILLLVVTTNLGLWAAWKRKKAGSTRTWFTNLSENIRNPWKREDEKLEELHRQVETISKHHQDFDIH